MTTYLDYSANPPENNSPPPVGAPENMPTSQLNNVMREIMSVIRQLGDNWQAGLDAQGSMADQDADAVAITGGSISGTTLAGTDLGITGLKAQNLAEGPIPAAIFPADTTPLNVKVARAALADNLTGTALRGLLPIGSIVLWFGTQATIPTGWHLCDGTSGTPDLRNRFVRGAANDAGKNVTGGAATDTASTTSTGAHDHGAVTGGTALTLTQMPAHAHAQQRSNRSGTGAADFIEAAAGAAVAWGLNTGSAGSGAAHTHPVGSDGAHTHSVTVDTLPPWTGVFYIMRIS